MKFQIKRKEKINLFDKSKEFLFVTAHPDDELMFFWPTIESLIKRNKCLNIICLSNGNFYGLGKERELELKTVSDLLTIKNLHIDSFEDSMILKWDKGKIAQTIDRILKEKLINLENLVIFTFDEYGITKHPNHISCCEGVIEYLKKNKEEIINKNVQTYLLNSYGALMQYIMQIFVGILFYYTPVAFCSFSLKKLYFLMSQHTTQFNWFRKLHIVFGSYSFFNNFTMVEFDNLVSEYDKTNNKKEN